MADRYEEPEESFTAESVFTSDAKFIIRFKLYREQCEHFIFKLLLSLVSSLEAHLMNESTSVEDVRHIADLVNLLLSGHTICS